MSELVFLLSAEIDIQSAYEFHETWQPGRGDFLLSLLSESFAQLQAFPESAPTFHKSFRRLLVHKFPYGIFYTIEGQRIIIAGVMNLLQSPSGIYRRLGRPGC